MLERNKTLLPILIILAAGGISLAAYYFAYLPYRFAKDQAVSKNEALLQLSRNVLYNSGSAAAIPYLEEADRNAVNPIQKAQIEVNLGQAYIGSNEPDLVQKGIELLKQVSLNTSYPVNFRSSAAQNVLGYYNSHRDVSFALANIFTGPTWGGFMQGKQPDAKGLRLAVWAGYLWVESFDTGATAYLASYRLAEMYASSIAGAASKTRDYNISQAQHYIQLGDAAYQKVVDINANAAKSGPSRPAPFIDSDIGDGLTTKAMALGFLYLNKAGGVQLNDVMVAFKAAFSVSEGNKSEEAQNISTILFAHYDKALFLAKDDPVAHKQEILDTLAPIYDLEQQYPKTAFYQGFAEVNGTSPTLASFQNHKDLAALAAIDPRFKTMLINLGWKATNFSQ